MRLRLLSNASELLIHALNPSSYVLPHTTCGSSFQRNPTSTASPSDDTTPQHSACTDSGSPRVGGT
jgi:hypothetical protein